MAAIPLGFCTVTVASPHVAALAGVVQVIRFADRTLTFVQAAPPTVTVAPLWKFWPPMLMVVPPLFGPTRGEISVTMGSALWFVFISLLLSQCVVEMLSRRQPMPISR